jgi:hypothetical protein
MYTIIDEENLNSDGQQVNEYQQSEQSSFALNYELKIKSNELCINAINHQVLQTV